MTPPIAEIAIRPDRDSRNERAAAPCPTLRHPVVGPEDTGRGELTHLGHPWFWNAVAVAGGMLGKKPGKHAKKARKGGEKGL
jgi:hypothetical protein